MHAEAIAKLQAEMAVSGNNAYVQAVGAFLLQHVNAKPQDAEKILTADKTIGKSLDEMRKTAEKKKVGNCAVLTDAEGFSVVLKYFGISSKGSASAARTNAAIVDPPSATFDVSLDDLLGG